MILEQYHSRLMNFLLMLAQFSCVLIECSYSLLNCIIHQIKSKEININLLKNNIESNILYISGNIIYQLIYAMDNTHESMKRYENILHLTHSSIMTIFNKGYNTNWNKNIMIYNTNMYLSKYLNIL